MKPISRVFISNEFKHDEQDSTPRCTCSHYGPPSRLPCPQHGMFNMHPSPAMERMLRQQREQREKALRSDEV